MRNTGLVGVYDGLVGLSDGLSGLNDGLVGEYDGLVGWNDGIVGTVCDLAVARLSSHDLDQLFKADGRRDQSRNGSSDCAVRCAYHCGVLLGSENAEKSGGVSPRG